MSCLYPGPDITHSFDQEAYEGAVIMFSSVTRELGSGVQSRSWGRDVFSMASKATNNPCLATYQCYNSSLLSGRKKKEERHQGCCLLLKMVSGAEK